MGIAMGLLLASCIDASVPLNVFDAVVFCSGDTCTDEMFLGTSDRALC